MTDRRREADRHKAKMAKRKAVQDAEVASKTVEKGLLIVNTGPGKGKSTAAFGLMLRALGHGWRVGVVQFIKGAWETGERKALDAFGDQITWHTMGEGFTWETQDKARDIAAADPRLRQGPRADGGRNHPPDRAGRAEHRAALRLSAAGRGGRRALEPAGDLHIVVTGRNAKPELIEAADLVTEMTLVKHHFAAGVKAQQGIEF